MMGEAPGATASLVLGIIGFLCCAILSIIALVYGLQAKNAIKATQVDTRAKARLPQVSYLELSVS